MTPELQMARDEDTSEEENANIRALLEECRVDFNAPAPVLTVEQRALHDELQAAKAAGCTGAQREEIKRRLFLANHPAWTFSPSTGRPVPRSAQPAPVKPKRSPAGERAGCRPGMETAAMLLADEREAESAWPELISAAELCSTPPPPVESLVDGLLVKLGISILSGASKSRKTWTAIDLGLAVASGIDWLGRPTSKGPVIYLNFELSATTMHRRLYSICQARGVDAPAGLHLWNLRGRRVNADILRKNLVEKCKALKPALVILDPFYKVSANSGADENSNDGQARLLSDLEVMARECGAALFMLHHFTKGNAGDKKSIDRGSGAGALARAPDAVLTLTEHEDDEVMVLEAALRDFAPVPATALRWVYPVWTVDVEVDAALLKRSGNKVETFKPADLFAVFRDGMTNPEWHAAIGWSDGTYRRKRDLLLSMGKVKLEDSVYRVVIP